MNYQQALDYLFKQLPMYQRVGKAAYKTDLNNTIKLCEILDNPHEKFKSVHIAGTNGKGSTSHMMASILQEAGYKTGLYTSPHLKDFRERIRINGEMISEEKVIDFITHYKKEFEAIQLSFFEWTVGLAFNYFAQQKVDIAVIETGLGGRLDSTNVVTPEVAAITNIGLDHTQFLGDTLSEIAKEKAGIIKKQIPVVIGEEQPEVKEVFLQKAAELNAKLRYAYSSILDAECDLKGNYQKKNINTAITTVEVLRNNGWNITNKNIQDGLSNVISNTGLLGRWQTLQESPTVICDTGHNEAGVREIVNQFSEINYQKLHVVLGVVNDKVIDDILQLFPKDASYYFCKADITRALPANELCEKAKEYGLEGNVYSSVKAALEKAKRCSASNDLIFVGGSTFVVAEVI